MGLVSGRFAFHVATATSIIRAAIQKKIGRGQWDLSVAEHLQPGETYVQAVVRGLQEELGIHTDVSKIRGPLGPCHRRTLLIPGVVHDVEFVASYRLDGFIGKLMLDEDEVQAVKWQSLSALQRDMQEGPERFTSWLHAELAMLRDVLAQQCLECKDHSGDIELDLSSGNAFA